MPQLVGRAYIRVDGELWRSLAGAKIDVGGIVTASVVGNEVHGYTESIKPAMVECEVPFAKGESIEKYRNLKDVVVTFELDTGQSYLVRDAHQIDPPVITDGDGGKIPMKFEGQPAEEVQV